MARRLDLPGPTAALVTLIAACLAVFLAAGCERATQAPTPADSPVLASPVVVPDLEADRRRLKLPADMPIECVRSWVLFEGMSAGTVASADYLDAREACEETGYVE
jgi:hypothetical protein